MNAFKHSGNYGDLIYSLPIVRHFGGGDFYLHLNQIDVLSRSYYNVPAPQEHQGRLNQRDFEFVRPLLAAQDYIKSVQILDPARSEITHNLDRFRDLFVDHTRAGNYVDCYATTFGIRDDKLKECLRQIPWLDVPRAQAIPGKTVVVNRTTRWIQPQLPEFYKGWRERGADKEAIFVGLPEEHRLFCDQTGYDIDFLPVRDLLEMASVIKGVGRFMGNQSVALSLAIGLGVEYYCEARRDLPIHHNECYFPNQPLGNYL
jgi:hypothetical protein